VTAPVPIIGRHVSRDVRKALAVPTAKGLPYEIAAIVPFPGDDRGVMPI
jgi:hypothetical protein